MILLIIYNIYNNSLQQRFKSRNFVHSSGRGWTFGALHCIAFRPSLLTLQHVPVEAVGKILDSTYGAM